MRRCLPWCLSFLTTQQVKNPLWAFIREFCCKDLVAKGIGNTWGMNIRYVYYGTIVWLGHGGVLDLNSIFLKKYSERQPLHVKFKVHVHLKFKDMTKSTWNLLLNRYLNIKKIFMELARRHPLLYIKRPK